MIKSRQCFNESMKSRKQKEDNDLSEEKGFKCEICDKTTIVSDEEVPLCCGQEMKQVPLDICTKPSDPEHARPMEDEDACDEFRGGS